MGTRTTRMLLTVAEAADAFGCSERMVKVNVGAVVPGVGV
jgi:hypothetical protein